MHATAAQPRQKSFAGASLPQAGWYLLKTTFAQWTADKAPKLGAALAYYTVFSLAPLLVIALAVAALFFDQGVAEEGMYAQLDSLLGAEGSKAVESLLESAQKPGKGIAATVLGAIALLFGASGVFGELQDSLNSIWKVKPKAKGGVWSFIRSRFLSFAMVLGVGFLLLVSLVISALVSGITAALGERFIGSAVLAYAINLVASLLTITLLFAMIFKLLPDVKVAWRDVWLGALFTAALFTIGKFLIGLYLGRASVASAYGAAGSIVIVLLWAYYSAQILFFGAEFTRVFAESYGSRSQGKPDEVK